MNVDVVEGFEPSRLKSLLEHRGRLRIRVIPGGSAHPLNEVLSLVCVRDDS
jgi:hypothetical protein